VVSGGCFFFLSLLTLFALDLAPPLGAEAFDLLIAELPKVGGIEDGPRVRLPTRTRFWIAMASSLFAVEEAIYSPTHGRITDRRVLSGWRGPLMRLLKFPRRALLGRAYLLFVPFRFSSG